MKSLIYYINEALKINSKSKIQRKGYWEFFDILRSYLRNNECLKLEYIFDKPIEVSDKINQRYKYLKQNNFKYVVGIEPGYDTDGEDTLYVYFSTNQKMDQKGQIKSENVFDETILYEIFTPEQIREIYYFVMDENN
jgi:hypothetical protein